MNSRSNAVELAEAYYDSAEADAFYQSVWGGEDIHIGIYAGKDEPIADASRRTVSHMAERLGKIGAKTRVLDLGAGYGGSARFLAENHGCHVTCLNLSETQNEQNRKLTAQAGLSEKIRVVHGDFENIPDADDSYDVVWSQDAILHSGNRRRVLDEVTRVLKEGGRFIFTDPMQADDCPDGVLQPILDRINLETLGSVAFYRRELVNRGFDEVAVEPLTQHLRTHYWRVGEALKDNYDGAVRRSGQDYVDAMIKGLQHWVDGADNGHLAWAIMDFRLSA